MSKNVNMIPTNKFHVDLGRNALMNRAIARRVADITQGEYQRKVIEITDDYWLRVLSVAGLVFNDMTGSRSKTEKLVQRLADKLAECQANGVTTQELVDELSRRTDIELEVGA